tara:strand:+ start:244 stop:477 length:234 start_codon:yes stop_codon:yes gene_type:complete
MGLINHLPLPSMPFQTHVNIVFQNGLGEPVKKDVETKESTRITPVEDLKLVNQMYTYNPNPNKLRTPDGQILDFIIA